MRLLLKALPALPASLPLAYCLWTQEPNTHKAVTPVTVRRPSLEMEPVGPQRDPFRPPALVAAAAIAPDSEELQRKNDIENSSSLAKAPSEPEVDLAQIAASRRLDGTMTRGDRRMAILDGRIYAQGMTLQGETAAIVVTSITRDRVIVSHGDRSAAITYSRPIRSATRASDMTEGNPHDHAN